MFTVLWRGFQTVKRPKGLALLGLSRQPTAAHRVCETLCFEQAVAMCNVQTPLYCYCTYVHVTVRIIYLYRLKWYGSERPFYCNMKATKQDPWPILTLQLERVSNTVENPSHGAGGEIRTWPSWRCALDYCNQCWVSARRFGGREGDADFTGGFNDACSLGHKNEITRHPNVKRSSVSQYFST